MQNGTTQLEYLLLFKKGNFIAAKLQVAIVQKIPFGRENIDFLGFDWMIKPYLEDLYKHEISSCYNNPYCTNKETLKESVNCSLVSITNSISNWASPERIPDMINECCEEESFGRCG